MKLKEEVRGAAAAEMRRQGCPDIAKEIEAGRDGGYLATGAVNAALSVIDEWEELEVSVHTSGGWAYLPLDGRKAAHNADPSYNTHTFYRRKPEPTPTVEELARRAVKAWKEQDKKTGPVCDAMEALDEATK